MKAGIYVRISDDKAGAGLGVARQEADCRQHVCDPRGWTVSQVYVDNDRSAYSGKPRPAYTRMLTDAEAGQLDAVVAWHPDRLHRHPRELEEFITIVDKAGIHIETVRAGVVDLSTPAGRMVARQLGAVARYESEHKADRQRRKHLELAQSGAWAGGGTRPFGFEADRTTIRPDEAQIIREVATRLLAGESLRGLCTDLQARGITTPTGNSWSQTPLKRMLYSARISGQREHHRQIVAQARWPAIITPQQTTQIRAVFDDPARHTARPPRSYLLKGLVRCGVCDATLVARPRGDGARRYVCARGPGFAGNGCVYALAEPLEEFVVEAVLWRLDSPELARAVRGQPSTVGDERQARADQATAKLEELAAAYANDEISMREWIAARAPVQQRLDEARRRLASDQQGVVLAEHAGNAGRLREQWPTLSLDARHAIMAAILADVMVRPGRRGYNRFDPGRFDLRWRH